MSDGFDQLLHVHFDAEFFHQLAMEAGFEGFAGLPLAAGKFPEAAEVRADVAPGDEEPAIAEDQTGGDFDVRRGGGGAYWP